MLKMEFPTSKHKSAGSRTEENIVTVNTKQCVYCMGRGFFFSERGEGLDPAIYG